MTAVSITLIGNLARDPELRFTASGKPVVNLTVVTSKSTKTEGGKWEDKDTTFWRCSAWDALAENIAESLVKGDAVIVHGSVAERQWEKDGETRSSMEVQAWNVGADLKRRPAKISRTERKTTSVPDTDPWTSPVEEPPF